jgi:hypothetical protein
MLPPRNAGLADHCNVPCVRHDREASRRRPLLRLAECRPQLLPNRELAPLRLHASGRVAVVGELAEDGRVERGPGRLAAEGLVR